MAHWLVKSEPESWSWADQAAAGTTHWDGVRNAQALNNMRRMAVGERALFYHSGKERRIIGIVEIVKPFYDDPNDSKSGLVDVRTIDALPAPVSLADIKAEPDLAHLALVRQPRLSVMPVDDDAWSKLCRMGGLTAGE